MEFLKFYKASETFSFFDSSTTSFKLCKNIWNESGQKDPITGEWEKLYPPIMRNINESCREINNHKFFNN